METSAARRHERLSHGFPVATTAAAPARYVRDGKRASAIHVPPVTAPSTRPERSNQASASTAAAAPTDRGEDDDAEATEPPFEQQQHDHQDRDRQRQHLRDREQELAHCVGRCGSRLRRDRC